MHFHTEKQDGENFGLDGFFYQRQNFMPARFVFFHAIISIASTFFLFFLSLFPFIPYYTAILRLTASFEFRLMPCSYTATIIVLLTHSISSSSCVCLFYRLITFFFLVTSPHRIVCTHRG